MKIVRNFIYIFVYVLLLLAPAAGKVQTQALKIVISPEYQCLAPGKEVSLKVKYINVSSKDIKVVNNLVHWANPFSCYAVNLTGASQVRLIALRAKTGITKEEMLVLRPGQSFEQNCPLGAWLSFPGEGFYLLQAYYGPFWGIDEACSNVVVLQISRNGSNCMPSRADRAMALETVLNDVLFLKNYWHREQGDRTNIFIEKNEVTDKINNLMFYAQTAEVIPLTQIKSRGLKNYFSFDKFEQTGFDTARVEYSYPPEGIYGSTILKKASGSWVEQESSGAEHKNNRKH